MPRQYVKKLLLVVSGALVIAGIVVTAAGARMVTNYPSTVKIENGPPAFHGTVTSPRQQCANKRHVAVFRKRPGRDTKLGGDTTGPAGRWKVVLEPINEGVYYARVRQRDQIVGGDGFVCEKDVSKDVVID